MRQNLRNVYRLLALQLVAVAVIAGVWSFYGLRDSYIALLGGGISILPNLFFAYRFFAKMYQHTPKQVLHSFYLNETFKMVISVLLLVLAVCLLRVKIFPLFSGFLGGYLGLWFMPLLVTREMKKVATR